MDLTNEIKKNQYTLNTLKKLSYIKETSSDEDIKKYVLVYNKQRYYLTLTKENNYDLNNKNFFNDIINFGKNFEKEIISIIKEEKIITSEDIFRHKGRYYRTMHPIIILLFLMMNEKIFNYCIESANTFLTTYGFVSNCEDKEECNLYILISDILCIYTCFYLFHELQKDKQEQDYTNILLFSLSFKIRLNECAISFINNYLKEKENMSYIKYTSTYDSNQKIWKQEVKYDNVIQKSILQLRNILSTNYSGIDYYICENCGEPFIRVNRNQKVHNIEQNYECRKDYDRKRQKKSYDKKRANTI